MSLKFVCNNPIFGEGTKNLLSCEKDYEAINRNGNEDFIVSVKEGVTLLPLGEDHTNNGVYCHYRVERDGFIPRILSLYMDRWQGGSDIWELVPLKN
jgi:hypothetical protein